MRVLLGVCVLWPTLAVADDEPAEPKGAEPKLITPTKAAAPATVANYSHKGQLEVSARVSMGLRAIATYNDGVYCGETDSSTATNNAPVCTGRSPFALDFELGYGVARKVDAFVEMRVGLEGDFAATASAMGGPHAFHVSPGARFFFAEGGHSKLFATAQAVMDFTGYKDAGGASRGADFGIRNMFGLWLDLDRSYGFYGYLGESMTFSRWLEFDLEAGFGIQARYR